MDGSLTSPAPRPPDASLLDEIRWTIADTWLRNREVTSQLGRVALRPHQVEAAARLLDTIEVHGGALLSDDTGMGKTYTALAVARRFHACVVVAPAALRDMWANALIETASDGRFVSYEQLSRGRPPPGAALTIVDEAHHARNPRTRRYATLARLTLGSNVLLLTATPIHNRFDELRAQLALFLGARAFTLGMEELVPLIVRRRHDVLRGVLRLPRTAPPITLHVESAPAVLRAIQHLPPALPTAGDGAADALLRLGLLRAWTSSDAALREALRRRLHRAEALDHALASGRFPTRRELAAWSTLDDTVQLAFPELIVASTTRDSTGLRRILGRHVDGIRRISQAIDAGPANDTARAGLLQRIVADHPGEQIVAFTQFTDTARAMYLALRPRGGIALVTAHGARIASGSVSRDEIIRRFGTASPSRASARLPLNLLIATDVLSEGLNLQGASVLVHLDLPWTVARLEQRLGRLRRMDAAREQVSVYSIGPPANARALAGVVRVLQRKARLLLAMSGDTDVWSHAPLLSSRSPPLRRANDDLTALLEMLRVELRSWLSWDTAPSLASREPLVAAAYAAGLDAPWTALLLARANGGASLVALEPSGATSNPAALLRAVRLASALTDSDRFALGRRVEVEPGDVGDAYRAAQRWCAERHGGALTAAALETPSCAHARVLRRLAALAASCPRGERATLGAEVAVVRRAVLSARGAGAEQVLTEWLATDATALQKTTAAKLASLREHLPDEVTRGRLDDHHGATVLVALLILVQRGR